MLNDFSPNYPKSILSFRFFVKIKKSEYLKIIGAERKSGRNFNLYKVYS